MLCRKLVHLHFKSSPPQWMAGWVDWEGSDWTTINKVTIMCVVCGWCLKIDTSINQKVYLLEPLFSYFESHLVRNSFSIKNWLNSISVKFLWIRTLSSQYFQSVNGRSNVHMRWCDVWCVMYPYLSLDVTQSGVLKSDTGEKRGGEERSLAAINTDNCHWLVRRDTRSGSG